MARTRFDRRNWVMSKAPKHQMAIGWFNQVRQIVNGLGTDQCGSGGETSGAGVVDQDGSVNLAVLLSITRLPRDCLAGYKPHI